MRGPVSLGHDDQGLKLVVKHDEANNVQFIIDHYIELGSFVVTADAL